MQNTLSISYDDWYKYIKLKKTHLLKNIDTTSFLDNSKDNKLFIKLLNGLFNNDIFDISRISYIALSFLDKYINIYLLQILKNDTDIILKSNILHKKNTDPTFNHTSNPTSNPTSNQTSNQTSNHTSNPTSNHTSNPTLNNDIYNLLLLIINLIVKIEFMLNIHVFMIIHLLMQKTDNSNNNNFIKPNILLKFEKLNNDIAIDIKPSSIILFILKINFKLLNNLDTLDTLDNNIDKLLLKDIILINNIKIITKKINDLLDIFMITIGNHIENKAIHNSNSNSNGNDNGNGNHKMRIYSICINYIIDIATLLYNYFESVFEVFLKYLEKEFPNQNNFNIIKKTISNLLKYELIKLEETLLA